MPLSEVLSHQPSILSLQFFSQMPSSWVSASSPRTKKLLRPQQPNLLAGIDHKSCGSQQAALVKIRRILNDQIFVCLSRKQNFGSSVADSKCYLPGGALQDLCNEQRTAVDDAVLRFCLWEESSNNRVSLRRPSEPFRRVLHTES